VWSRAREPEAGEIPRPRITVAMKIAEISNRLLWSPEGISFFSLFSSDVTKLEVIVTFLAILELIRLRRLKVRQPRPFAEIMVYPNGKH
jgi:segregation and condensation protein A